MKAKTDTTFLNQNTKKKNTNDTSLKHEVEEKYMNHISPEQMNYLRQMKLQTFFIMLSRFLLLFAFIILWETSSTLGWIDSFFFSSPSAIVTLFIDMCKDILTNGTSTEGEKVRPHWEDGTPAYTIKKFGVV